jgi:chorismate mutase/prephenate dehydratase
LPETGVRAVFREVLAACRGLVRPIRVAYLGPKYSYSHLAAIDRFGDGPELVPVATIKAVFESVHYRQTDYGIVPLENSTDGRIVDTLDMFARLPLRITGEVELAIHHHLLGKCARSEVVEVYSKPQALSQCRDWLAKNLPHAKTIEMTSTALAAQIAADKPGAAAIASLEAGTHYGLNVLDRNIEDNKQNVTRFAVIGGESPPRTGHDKTALMFEIPHKPGALADAMIVFKRSRLNLTWIESFPMPGTKNEYLFFVEFEGHQAESRVKKALEGLRRRTARLEILGSYPRALPPPHDQDQPAPPAATSASP